MTNINAGQEVLVWFAPAGVSAHLVAWVQVATAAFRQRSSHPARQPGLPSDYNCAAAAQTQMSHVGGLIGSVPAQDLIQT